MFKTILAAVVAVPLMVSSAWANSITIVGSSTVFPFSTTVAERFALDGYPAPVVESTGTGGGFKLFCADKSDIVNASRQIKPAEHENCIASGVTPVEHQIGFDGIVIGQSVDGVEFQITERQLFLALAKKVPIDANQFVPNPFDSWYQISPNLPDVKIRVLGPPPTSGTRDAFLEIAMENGAKDVLKQMEIELTKDQFKTLSHTIREDGAYVEAGENDNLVLQKLQADPTAVGIFGFSFLENNRDSVRGLKINGVSPEFEEIAEGNYPISRSLFFYVAGNRLVNNEDLQEYIKLFLSEDMIGEDGALIDKGLIPLE